MDLPDLVERLGRTGALDRLAKPLAAAVKRAAPPKSRVKDALSGTWLGHPLHPLLTDLPIGSFTSATVLDLVGGAAGARPAERLVQLGLVTSVAAAAAGAADWSDSYGQARRVGVVHAAANLVGVSCYAASAIARRGGRRGAATTWGLVGMGALGVGGYLGGHLGWVHGVGVNHAFAEDPPQDWAAAGALDDLPVGEARRVDVGGAAILLFRNDADIVAIGSRCSHAGGPLEDGDIDRAACTVTCPWHQSEFDLATGHVVHGPASVPQTAYDTRVVDGRIEVRARA